MRDWVDIDLVALNQLYDAWLETDLEFTTVRGDAVMFHPNIDFLCESKEIVLPCVLSILYQFRYNGGAGKLL